MPFAIPIFHSWWNVLRLLILQRVLDLSLLTILLLTIIMCPLLVEHLQIPQHHIQMGPVSIDHHILRFRINLKPHFLQTVIQDVPVVQHGCSMVGRLQMRQRIWNWYTELLAHLLHNKGHLDSVLKLVGQILSNLISVIRQLFNLRFVFIAQHVQVSQPSKSQILYLKGHLAIGTIYYLFINQI